MNALTNSMKSTASVKETENGAVAYSTTGSALLNFFALGGAMRNREPQEIAEKFLAAYDEDPDLALKAMFYIGDIRGGLGERKVFTTCLCTAANRKPEVIKPLMSLIPKYSRWDVLVELIHTGLRNDVMTVIDEQLTKDWNNHRKGNLADISLLAKWMPSENTSCEWKKIQASILRNGLKISARNYRKLLSALRADLDVVERKMSSKEWDKIQYSGVPSCAMNRYRNAFYSNDVERFLDFISKVNAGTEKINAGVLYPYNLTHNYMSRYSVGDLNPVTEAQWNALPDYVDKNTNVLVMADVSGSMTGRPMETSIGLATYFAQRNSGDFAGLYMTFDTYPQFLDISKYDTLRDCVEYVMNAGVGMSTNLDRAFETLLDKCVENNITQEDIPAALVVVSDMEIDEYGKQDCNLSFVDKWEEEFKAEGYKLPKLVFWNVEARHDTFLHHSNNVLYVSGQSTTVFEYLTSAIEGKTQYEFMLDILNSERYSEIHLYLNY